MEVLDELNSNEKHLSLLAAAKRMPLAGTFELLPVCNMDCRMCYIRTTPEEMHKQGRMLSADEWIRIAEQARDAGLLYLLLTGGEPFLYPEFEKLYTWLATSGIIPLLNTNGTLVNEDRADLLAKYPPRKVNISLYGASDETYGRLCRNPHGFTQVMNAIRLLQERKIPVKINCSLTPYNAEDLEQMVQICADLNVPFQVTTYMFPPIRKNGIDTECFARFTPEEAAELHLRYACLSMGNGEQWKQWVSEQLDKLKPENAFEYKETGFSCFAAKNNFWINWKGQMLPCGMLTGPYISAAEHSFEECWNTIVDAGSKVHNPKECITCDKRALCHVCSAASCAETGDYDGKPEYLCRMTDAYIRKLKEIAEHETE